LIDAPTSATVNTTPKPATAARIHQRRATTTAAMKQANEAIPKPARNGLPTIDKLRGSITPSSRRP
jgi:hypothetical protein